MAEIKAINLTVENVLGDLANTPLLSTEETLKMIKLIRKGDEKATEEFKQKNACFVAAVAKRYIGKGLSIDELMEAGNNGLIAAANKYNKDSGIRFITFAIFWIRQGILEVLPTED
jgi:RNA polymerase primary sigma factor